MLQDKAVGRGNLTSLDFHNVANDKIIYLNCEKISVSLHITHLRSEVLKICLQYDLFLLCNEFTPAIDAKGAKPDD